MASRISYFILFGVICFTHGKPAFNYESSSGQTEIQKLLQDLSSQQGKYDIALSHHEDGPKSHHEDKARISPHDEKPYNPHYNDKHYEGEAHYHSSHEKQASDNQPSLTNIQSLNLFYKKKPSTVSRNGDNNDVIDQFLELQSDRDCAKDKAKCIDRNWHSVVAQRNENDNVDEILEFLSELENNLEENDYGVDSRCAGKRCARSKPDSYDRNRDGNDRKDLRCKGKSCSRYTDRGDDRDDDDRDFRYNLRCIGDRCGRSRDDRADDDRDDRNNLRCTGDRCARSRDDRDDDDRNDLRCTGDRCGRSRDDRDDDDRDDRNNLRCTGDRCGRSRDDRDDDRDYRSGLRCTGDRCGRSRDDRDDDDRDDRNDLRCTGDRCGRSRDDRDDDDKDDRNDLRCVGDRCGRSRDDRDDDDRDDRNDLRCTGDRCGRSRDDRDDDRDDRNNLRCIGDRCGRSRDDRDDDDRDDRNNLRCSGDRCGRSRDDRDDDRDDRNNLRCRGNKCARSRNDDNDEDDQYESQRRPKQYKLSDDLEAVVLDISDLDRLLSNINVRKNKLRGAKLLENVDLDSIISYSNGNDKKANVEAVVFDLEKEKDRNALSKQVKRLLSQGLND